MAAGTIAVTNGSKSVVGSGTSFTTDLKPNDFFYFDIGETTYMVVVDTITSDTQMTMLKSFSGATSDGISWGVVPRKGLAMIAAQSVKDMAEYMRSSVLDKVNWQGVFSELDQVTVTLLDGSTFTGPSWKKISDQLSAIDIDDVTAIATQVRSDAQQVSADKDTLTPLMAQARTDAQQVAADKETVDQAKTDAVQAKTDAVAARDAAAQSAADAEKAANEAGGTKSVNGISVDSSGNVALTASNIPTTVANTSVQDAVTALSARMGYALVTTSSNLALNSRMVLTNPFGANTPVVVECEIFHATSQKWVTTPWVSGLSSSNTYGVLAAYSEGEGIILRSAPVGFVAANPVSGSSQEFSGNYTTPSPIRVHVFKVAS